MAGSSAFRTTQKSTFRFPSGSFDSSTASSFCCHLLIGSWRPTNRKLSELQPDTSQTERSVAYCCARASTLTSGSTTTVTLTSGSGLLLCKGVYPYEWEHFAEPQLPPKEAFYSKLTDDGISEKDYAHAQKVWDVFRCCDQGDYYDLYNRTDFRLLADVFENFQKTSALKDIERHLPLKVLGDVNCRTSRDKLFHNTLPL